MRILFLGEQNNPLVEFLRETEEQVIVCNQMIDCNSQCLDVDFIVSYGYRFLIKKDILNRFPRKAINLHISYLPWNRGSDPNLWSFLKDTAKGVSIHLLNDKLDKGEIIVQKCLSIDENCHTLATSYELLQSEMQALFKKHWQSIKSSDYNSFLSQDVGSYQSSADKTEFWPWLSKGWNTPISQAKQSYKHYLASKKELD